MPNIMSLAMDPDKTSDSSINLMESFRVIDFGLPQDEHRVMT